MSNSGNIAGYKMDTEIIFVFLYSEESQREIKKVVQFKIASRREKSWQ